MVGFNAQSAVDGENHRIAAVEVTNASHDKGQLTSMEKAGAEFTLSALSDNITRAAKLLGVAELVQLIASHQARKAAA